MASWLVRSFPDRAVRPCSGTLCCVLGQDTWLSQCISPPRRKMGTGELLGKPNKLRGVTSVPPRGSRNAPSRSCYTQTRINAGLISQSWLQGFTFTHRTIFQCLFCRHPRLVTFRNTTYIAHALVFFVLYFQYGTVFIVSWGSSRKRLSIPYTSCGLLREPFS